MYVEKATSEPHIAGLTLMMVLDELPEPLKMKHLLETPGAFELLPEWAPKEELAALDAVQLPRA
jgi:hypothetical protein